MSILNVNQIQPVGSGQTVTISAANITASSSTISASSFVGDVTGDVTGNVTGIVTATGGSITGVSTIGTTNLTVNGNAFPTAGPLSNRNLIINGSMQVAQRGISTTSTSYGTVDRFRSQPTSGTVTQSQESLTSGDPYDEGFRHFLRATNTTAGSNDATEEREIRYYVEAQDLAKSGWNYTSSTSYLTISFWVRSSLAGTYYNVTRSLDGTGQNYTFSYTLTADTWTKVTHTIPGNSNITIDNDNGVGLQVNFMIDLGTDHTDSGHTLNTWAAFSGTSRTPDFGQDWAGTTDATFDITGVQLEVGSVATPFEHRSYGDELARCQRYYQKIPVRTYSWCGYCFSTTDARTAIPLITTMRSTGQTIETTNTPRFCTTGGAGTGSIVLASTSLDAITVQSSGATGLGGAGTTSAMRASSGTAYIGVESEL